MENIIIYPKNEKQQSLLKSLLEEMKVRFVLRNQEDESLLSEEEFYSKIDRSIAQANRGKAKGVDKNQQKQLLGL